MVLGRPTGHVLLYRKINREIFTPPSYPYEPFLLVFIIFFITVPFITIAPPLTCIMTDVS